MRHIYQGTFKDQNGAVVGSSTTSDGNPGTVTVYLAGTTTLASVYTASTGGVAVNSVTTDAYGYFYFWVDDTEYAYTQLFKIVLTHPDFTTRTYDNIQVIYVSITAAQSQMILDGYYFTQAGTGGIQRTQQNKSRDIINYADFAPADRVAGTTDETAYINAAYLAASVNGATLYFPPWTMKFTSQLVWNKSVNIIGDDRNKTIFKKSGNFVGIKIGHATTGAGGEQRYENFTVDSFGGTDAASGIEIFWANNAVYRNLQVKSQGSHGIVYQNGFLSTFDNILCVSNGADGFKVEGKTGLDTVTYNCNANSFINIHCLSNGGIGFNIEAGDSNYGMGIVCEQNTGNGLRINGLTNFLQVYTESNTAKDILMDTSSVRNLLVINGLTGISDYDDDGTNNGYIDLAAGYYFNWTNIISGGLNVSGGMKFSGLSAYTNNADAKSNGLVDGDIYRIGDTVAIVHA